MPTLAAWLHNIDPFAIKFPDGFFLDGIRWYGLAYLAAFVVCWLFCRRLVRTGGSSLHPKEITDFVIAGAIAVVVGGRLGYVIFYKPHLLIEFYSGLPFWGVLDLKGGGMSSHGGMIGVALVVWWYARFRRKLTLTRQAEFDSQGKLKDHVPCRKCKYDLHQRRKESTCPECGTPVSESFEGATMTYTIERHHRFLHLFDITAISAAVGFFFGRIANFINGELVGRECDPDLPWAVKFPQDMFEWVNTWARGSTASAEAGAAAADKLRELAPAMETVGVSAGRWLSAISDGEVGFVENGVGTLIHTIQSGPSASAQTVGSVVAPLLSPHHPSQLYACFLEGFLVFVILTIVWLRPRKPGVIAGLFGFWYGLMRIIDEMWRAPDAHIKGQEFAHFGITRGQLLSVFLMLAGAALTWWCARRNVEKMGGLLRRVG